MKFTDFLIIYLSCGAPFGVFFLVRNREEKNSFIVYLKSAGLIFVWIPYALRLLNDFAAARFSKNVSDKSVGEKLEKLEKEISRILLDSNSEISVFELREIFERYSGLTLARNNSEQIPSAAESEIFRIALREKIDLGAKCLHRRNILRIESHQATARKDFFKTIGEINRATTETDNLRSRVNEFINIIGDFEAATITGDSFSSVSHHETNSPAEISEQNLPVKRKTNIRQQSPVSFNRFNKREKSLNFVPTDK